MLIGIFGNFGSGKTLFLTYMLLKYASKGYEVYANYHVKSRRVKFLNPEDFIELSSRENRIVVGLDEVYLWLDSRVSTSKVNRLLSWIILQSRKRNMDIIYTAQLSSTVDTRLKSMTDLTIIAERVGEHFQYSFIWERNLKLKRRIFILPYWKARRLMDYYDTREIVEPIGLEELKEALLKKRGKIKNEA